MIIKIDHFTLVTENSRFKPSLEFLSELGYKLKFLEKNKDNPVIKRPLMKKFTAKHDIALMISDGNLDIEVINYGEANKKNNLNIVPIFSGLPKKFIFGNGTSKGLIKINGIDNQISINKSKSTKFIFNSLIVKTSDLKESIKFWEVFGFKLIKKNKNSAELEFKSILKNNYCRLILNKKKQIDHPAYLDDRGFNFLAFISSSASQEKTKIKAAGYKATGAKTLKVDGKNLEVFFASGRQGEIVEIIGIKK